MRVFKFSKRLFVIYLVSCIFLSSCSLFEASWEEKEKKYYADDNNFSTYTGTIVEIPNEDGSKKYYFLNIDFDEPEKVQYEKRVELSIQSFEIINNNGFFTEVSIGDKIEVILAPRIFGDGYVIPAAGISVNGKIYLTFSDGKAIILKLYD